MALGSKSDLGRVVTSTITLFEIDGDSKMVELLRNADISSEMTYYDNWNGGQDYYSIYLSVPITTFASFQKELSDIETKIKEKIELVIRDEESEHVQQILIVPEKSKRINWDIVSGTSNKEKLISEINFLKNTMVSVSTGGQRIQDINTNYQRTYLEVDKILKKLSLDNPNQFNDLWQWYGKWSAEFASYAERRTFISDLYSELLKTINESEDAETYDIEVNISGWERVNRTVNEIRRRISEASTEEQFQGIGLLCRDVIISLAQEIYDIEKYPPIDGTNPSDTDAKRMLEAYIQVKLGGSSKETVRRYAKSTLSLANELTHKRTATKKEAMLCSSATLNLISLVKIIEED